MQWTRRLRACLQLVFSGGAPLTSNVRRVRKVLPRFIVVASIAGALFYLYGAWFNWKMRNTEIHLGRIALMNSLPKFLETHSIPSQFVVGSSERRVFPVTNTVNVAGKLYQCALGYETPRFDGAGFLTISGDGVVLWLDAKSGPRIVDRSYVSPFLRSGF